MRHRSFLQFISFVLCCSVSGCFTSWLDRATTKSEQTSEGRAAYVGKNGDLIVETTVGQSQRPAEADFRYLVIERETMIRLIGITLARTGPTTRPVMELSSVVPHRYVARVKTRNGVAEVDPNVLVGAGPRQRMRTDTWQRVPIEYDFENLHATVKGSLGEYMSVHYTRDGLGTGVFVVLVVPAVALDVVTFPVQFVVVLAMLSTIKC
jgi:hypothetical protein